MKLQRILLLCCLIVVAVSPLMATLSVTLSPNPAGPQPVGTTIKWTATVSGDPDQNPVYEYRFSAELTGTPVLVRRGFGSSKSFTWTPSAFEGNFAIGTTVKNVHARTHATASASYTLTSRVTSGQAMDELHQSSAGGVFQYKLVPGPQLHARPLHTDHGAGRGKSKPGDNQPGSMPV